MKLSSPLVVVALVAAASASPLNAARSEFVRAGNLLCRMCVDDIFSYRLP